MLDDQGVTAAEPTATPPAADPSQATTQPEQQNGGQTVPYERFQQVNARMREYERQVQSLSQRIQQFESTRQQTGQPVTDEERALREAREALHRVDPTLKELPGQLQQINGVITQMAQRDFVSSGERMIESFASKHGLTATDLSNTLAAIIQNDPALMARAQKGDVSLVAQYLKGLEPVVASFKKQGADAQRTAAATTAQTKLTGTATVPPRAPGGPPGPSAPEKVTAANAESVKSSILDRFRTSLASMGQQG